MRCVHQCLVANHSKRAWSTALSSFQQQLLPHKPTFSATGIGVTVSNLLGLSDALDERSYSCGSFTYETDKLHSNQQQTLQVTDLPPYIILLRHGESAGLESLQEDLQIPNHRIPLSAKGVLQAIKAGQIVHQLLHESASKQQSANEQCSNNEGHGSVCSTSTNRVFLYTSPFLRCIQTAQHAVKALSDEQVVGFQEEVQLREQDWGNFQAPGQQARNYDERLKYGRFFFRFPDGESAADVYDRMTMFQDHFVRDTACKRFAGGTSVLMVTHGLAMRLFLMKWLHWTVDDFLQVYNPPPSTPILLQRHCPTLPNSTTKEPGAAACSVPLEAIKACYRLAPESLASIKGISADMAQGRVISSKQQLMDWRPYQKQVPPPPAMDPVHEAIMQELMDIGYAGDGRNAV